MISVDVYLLALLYNVRSFVMPPMVSRQRTVYRAFSSLEALISTRFSYSQYFTCPKRSNRYKDRIHNRMHVTTGRSSQI